MARGPVFFVGGPSGSGKTTTMHHSMQRVQSVVHLDADLLYGLNDAFESPEDDYATLSSIRLHFAWSLMQSGRPVVLWGAGTPEQSLTRPECELFSGLHFMSLVCTDEALLQRLHGRHDFDRYSDEFIERTLDYLHYLRDPNRNKHSELLDTSLLTAAQVSDAIGVWVDAHVKQ